ncbi:MAG: phosphotransferase [Pseudomonadales bacterium]|nr:phosphotransferase [Pseudomonadales bacterium]
MSTRPAGYNPRRDEPEDRNLTTPPPRTGATATPPVEARTWAHAALGLDGAARWTALPVEASNRRFYRVQTKALRSHPASWILMTSPPALERNAQFVELARVFAARGIGVPAILAEEPAAGWFVLEDLGTRHLADVYPTPERDAALAGALDTLLALQTVDDPAIEPYTRERFADELWIFREWFVEGLLDIALPDGLAADTFGRLIDATDAQPRCCVHRDFHCRNLMYRPDGRIGVVDFQDALAGPAAYDLASLLRDCYYVFDEAEIGRWRDAYVARSPLPLDPATFPRQFDFTALQRQLKAVGIFARLELRDGKASHLGYILPVATRIATLARRYPTLEPFARWLDAQLPRAAARLVARP